MSPSGRKLLTPLLWGLMFLCVGLVGIFIISPKYADRRAKLDQQFAGRQRAMEETSERNLEAAGVESKPEASRGHSALYFAGAIVLGGTLLLGFAFYALRQGRGADPESPPPEDALATSPQHIPPQVPQDGAPAP